MKQQIKLFVCNSILVLLCSVTNAQENGKEARKQYNIQQATSERAQLHTIAFDGLAFVTGSFGGDTFFPPGKVADFFGFQYMRDNDSNSLGHNTDFSNPYRNKCHQHSFKRTNGKVDWPCK